MRCGVLPVLCLALLWTSCDKPAAPPVAGTPGADSPGLSLTATEIPSNGSVNGRQLGLKGHGCSSVRVRLLHLESGKVHPLTEYTFEGLPPAFEGTLWLLAQDGEPFGKKGQVCYTLTHSLKAGSVSTSSASPILFEGPYTMTSEATDTSSRYEADREYVVFRRLMSRIGAGQSFGSEGVEDLARQTAGKSLEILALALRWK